MWCYVMDCRNVCITGIKGEDLFIVVYHELIEEDALRPPDALPCCTEPSA